MRSLNSLVYSELTRSGSWLTITQIVSRIPEATGRYETVSRALRRMRAKNFVTARQDPVNKRYWQWCSATSGGTNMVGIGNTTGPTAATLRDAVELVVTTLVADQKAFSAHDVTVALREKANKGALPVDSTSTVHFAGQDVPRIDHDKVKAIVVELFDAGKMIGYDRSNTGQYWQYAPMKTSPTTSSAPASSAPYDGSSTL